MSSFSWKNTEYPWFYHLLTSNIIVNNQPAIVCGRPVWVNKYTKPYIKYLSIWKCDAMKWKSNISRHNKFILYPSYFTTILYFTTNPPKVCCPDPTIDTLHGVEEVISIVVSSFLFHFWGNFYFRRGEFLLWEKKFPSFSSVRRLLKKKVSWFKIYNTNTQLFWRLWTFKGYSGSVQQRITSIITTNDRSQQQNSSSAPSTIHHHQLEVWFWLTGWLVACWWCKKRYLFYICLNEINNEKRIHKGNDATDGRWQCHRLVMGLFLLTINQRVKPNEQTKMVFLQKSEDVTTDGDLLQWHINLCFSH